MTSSFKSAWRLGIIGIITGFINGFIGIGGGTILIPAMVFWLGEEQHTAHGTALAIILPTALVSTYIYNLNSHMDWALTLKIITGSVIGGYLGARLMQKIPAPRLKQIFGLFMMIAGARMLI